MASTFRSSALKLQDNIADSRKSISHSTDDLTDNTTSRTANVKGFGSDSSAMVQAIKKKVGKYELLDDVPSSETPKKRNYPIPATIPQTKSYEDIVSQTNKMPLGNVDVNLTTQTPAPANRIRKISAEQTCNTENAFEKKLAAQPFGSEREFEGAKDFKSRIASSARRKPLSSH